MVSLSYLKNSLYNPSKICYIAVRTFSPTTLEIVCGRLETVGLFIYIKEKLSEKIPDSLILIIPYD